MKARPTLYELLGLAQTASTPEIDAAFRRESNALEAQRAAMDPREFNDRVQLLRVARSTLADPVSRTGYDAKLEAMARSAPPAAAARAQSQALALRDEPAGDPTATAAAAELRADALSLRADALSLRADALMARAGMDMPMERPAAGGALVLGKTLAEGALTGASRLTRALGLLVVIGIVTFLLARCAFSGSDNTAAQMKAMEKVRLQEYYQTHGVRPANLAELELLEAERRRAENEERLAEQDRRRQEQAQQQQERQEQRFEEEARQRGQEVSAELRRAEEQQRYEQLREEQIKLQEEQTRLARERVQAEREQMRQEAQQQQWRKTLQR